MEFSLSDKHLTIKLSLTTFTAIVNLAIPTKLAALTPVFFEVTTQPPLI